MNRPRATKTIARGKICQNNLNENSVTAFVIGTGPVSVIDIPKSSHVQTSAPAGFLFIKFTRPLLFGNIVKNILCFLYNFFGGFDSSTAMIITALSKKPSPSVSRAILSNLRG